MNAALRHPEPEPIRQIEAAIFVLLMTLYLLTTAGGFHIVDEVSLFAVTESLGRRGAVDTNAIAWMQWVNSPGEVLGAFGPEGDVYSKKGPAPAFLAVPIYLAARTVPGLGLVQATLLYNALVTTLTALLLGRWTRALGYDARVGATVALSFGLGTLAWPYATYFLGEPTSALCLTGAGYALTRWRATRADRHAWATGIALGGLLATVAAHALLLPIFALYALRDPNGRWRRPERRTLIGFLLPLGLVIGLLAVYNAVRFGSPISTGYHFEAGEGWTTPLWQGLWGLLFSPYRGLIWYTPLSLAAALAWRDLRRTQGATAGLIAGAAGVLTALYSAWWMWWGGFAWGPRFLAPLCPLLALILAPWWERVFTGRMQGWKRRGFLTLAALSVLVQLLAVAANYPQFEIELRGLYPTDWEDPLRYGPPALFNPLHSPIIGQLRLLWRDPLGASDLFWVRPDGVAWTVPLAALPILVLAGAQLVRTVRTNSWKTARSLSTGPASEIQAADSSRSREKPTEKHDAAIVSPALLAVPILAFILWGSYALAVASTDPRYGEPGVGYRAVLDAIAQQARPEDVIVTIAPYHYHIPMAHDRTRLPIYGYAQEEPLHAETSRVLSRLLGQPRNVWLVTGGIQPADPSNGVERWLAAHAYEVSDQWYDDFRLVRFLSPLAGMTTATAANEFGGAQGDRIALVDVAWGPAVNTAGGGVRVAAVWTALQPVQAEYVPFLHLLDASGQLRAQRDLRPVGGYRPTTTWAPGEPIEDHMGLALPDDLPPGEYELVLGLYAATSGQRLLTTDGGDRVRLGTVVIRQGDQ